MILTRQGVAYRVACDLPEGSYVNLGVGIPTLIPTFLPGDKEIFVHSENGILGLGPYAEAGLVLREVAPGLDAKAVQAKTEAPLSVASDCREMNVPAEFKGIKLSARQDISRSWKRSICMHTSALAKELTCPGTRRQNGEQLSFRDIAA